METVRISDANVLAWRELSLGGGDGRGCLEDWLASGCWPDAAEAAQIVVAGDRAWHAHAGRATPLPDPWPAWGPAPNLGRWPPWPVAWETCGLPGTLCEAALRTAPYRDVLRAAAELVEMALAEVPGVDHRAHEALAETRRWATGSLDRGYLFVSASEANQAAAVSDGAAQRAYWSAATLASGSPSRAVTQACTALSMVRAADGCSDDVTARFMADTLRRTIPWHVVLDGLLRGLGGAAPTGVHTFSPGESRHVHHVTTATRFSVVLATLVDRDETLTAVYAHPGPGEVALQGNARATGPTSVAFWVIDPRAP